LNIYNTTGRSQATLGYKIIYWRDELLRSADSRQKVWAGLFSGDTLRGNYESSSWNCTYI